MVSNLTGIAWEHSWMLGDKITDVQFGLNAGMRSILIDSNGDNGVLFSTVPDIQKAVEVICANETNS
jgi:histidinol phosphatase-like enzyme